MLLLQIIQWLAHHGSATLKLHARFGPSFWFYDQPLDGVGPRSWHHFQHGVNVLPALVPNLQHLSLACEKGFMIAEQDLFSLQTLTRLQTLRLEIASNGQWHLETLSPLQHLTALEQLDMDVRRFGACPMSLAPGFSKLTLLTTLSLKQRSSPHHKIVYDTVHAGNVIGNLTRLQKLSVSRVLDRIPDAFSKLENLQTLSVGGADDDWPGFSVQPSISSCKHLSNLRLHSFSITSGTGWLSAWSALSGLPSLSKVRLACIDLEAVASNEWAFGSSITSLSIESGNLGGFPEALPSLTTLRHLNLYQLNLEGLPKFPAGPYLEHITSLDLCETRLPAFPGALVQASRLEKIDAFDDEHWLDAERLKSILPRCCVLNIMPVHHASESHTSSSSEAASSETDQSSDLAAEAA